MNRIRELRKQMNMTQKELAKHLQVADSTLSYWEMGKYEPDNDALLKLSRFFQVPIDYILDGDFKRWDINGHTIYNYVANQPRLEETVMSVSEPEAAYRQNRLENSLAVFNRIEFEGLTQAEIDVLAEYADFIKSRRKMK